MYQLYFTNTYMHANFTNVLQMDYNFNGQYPFTWPAGHFIANFNATNGSGQPSGGFSINQPIPGMTPVPMAIFNCNVLPGPCRIGDGLYPFSINPHFQSVPQQNPHFGSNWNFRYNNSMQMFSHGTDK